MPKPHAHKLRAIVEYDDGVKEKLDLSKEEWRRLEPQEASTDVDVDEGFNLDVEDAPQHDHLAGTDTLEKETELASSKEVVSSGAGSA